MVCSAFEALLDISDEGGKTKIFSYALKLLWGFNERIAKWATELYQIRSQIVHGAVVGDEKLLASQDRHYPHLEIARRVFIDSLQFILESLGFIVLRVGYKTEAIWEIQNLVMSNKEKIRSFLSNKSNWTYKTFKANIEIFEDFIQLIESYT